MSRSASAEDYLESILVLTNARKMVRATDIAEYFGFSKPSVSVAMKKLRESGQIAVDDLGSITLTEIGRAAAASVYERHRVLEAFLLSLGVSRETAEKDACLMEHIISDETFLAIKEKL